MKTVPKAFKFKTWIFYYFLGISLVLLSACGSGGGGDDSSGTSTSGKGSVSFDLALQNSSTSRALNNRQLDDNNGRFECQTEAYEIDTIEAQVVDENDELLAEGGPFDCEDRQGDISDVEAGDGRIVKVSAKDESGKVVAEGKSDPVTVIAGQTVKAGTIILALVNTAPVADAGPDQTPFVGDTVTLDGSGSSDVDGDSLTYSWSFTSLPAGSEATLSDPTVDTPTFEVDVRGTYVVQLIVSDGALNSDPDTVTIKTKNRAPVADAGPDQTPFVGDTVTLDGSGSSDVDGDSLTYSWSFTSLPAGSEATLSDPTVDTPTFEVDVRGTYVVQLIVSDGTVNSDPDTVTIETRNRAPVADAGPDQTPLWGDFGATGTLDGSGSSDVDGDSLTYSWSFTEYPVGLEISPPVLDDPTVVNPTFEIYHLGNYVAQLIVSDGTVNSDPDTVTINTQNSAPVADAGPDQTTFVGDTVTLDGSGSSDVDGDSLTYSWSFTSLPAGSEATLSDPTAVNPTFDVDAHETYVAQLIVSDGSANSGPDTVTINTQNSAPVADAGPDQTPFVGDTVTLDGSGSSDVDGDSLTYSWSFTSLPAGSEATLSDPTAVNPTFDVDAHETYVAQLIVKDGALNSDLDTVTINTQNSAPVADAGPDQTTFVGDTVTLDGSGSSDVDGDSLTYSWSFTEYPVGYEISPPVLDDPTAVNPTFDVDVRGTYVAQLIVSDGTVNSDPDTVTINTQNSAPVADAGPDQTPIMGDTVTLDGSGSSDVDGDSLTYSWSFTSLPAGSEAILSDPTAVNPTFDVDAHETYVAQLIVSDGSVNSSPDTVTINTQNSAPVADAGPEQKPFVGDTVTLDGSGSSDVDGDPLSYFWSFTSLPPGSKATLSDPAAVNPTFKVDVRGTYVAQLIVSDGTVNSDPDTVTINTKNSAPVAVAGTDQPTPFVGDTVTLDGSGSSDVDRDSLTYSWSFTSLPEGSEATLSDPTVDTPTFEVDVRGTYVAQLIVSDGTVNSDPDTVTINTKNRAPVAVAGTDKPWPSVGDTVTLDGSGSSDVDRDSLTYSWSFTPAGSEATLSDPTAVNPTFDVDPHETYVAQLIVNDGDLDSNPDTVTINVQNSAPVLDPIGFQSVAEYSLLEFTIKASDLDGDALRFTASYLPDGASFIDNGNNTATFTWRSQGSALFTVTFEVFDNQSPAESDSEVVWILVTES